MSTFDELVAKQPRGVLYYFNVSLDGGSTFTKRYAQAWFSPDSPPSSLESEPRIMSMGNLTRALGADRGLTAATLDIELDNADGGVDWLSNRTTYASQAISSVWVLKCLVWDPNTGTATYATDFAEKTLGSFTLMNPPQRGIASIKVKLGDACLTQLDINTPTPADWAAITDANRPFTDDQYRAFGSWGVQQDGTNCFPIDSPLPVAWGYGPLPAVHLFKNCYVICAVPGSAGALPATLEAVFTGSGVSIPSVITPYGSSYTAGDMTVWTVRRTPDIVKNGKTWHLLWIDLDLTGDGYDVNAASGKGDSSVIWGFLKSAGYDLSSAAIADSIIGGTGQVQTKNRLGYAVHDVVGPITVVGTLMSHNATDLPFRGTQAATVVSDIFTTCIKSPISVAGVAATNNARPGSFVAHSIDRSFSTAIQPDGSYFKELVAGETLTAIRQLCEVGRFDVFFKWDGTVQIATLSPDYASQTDTLVALQETDIKSGIEVIPAIGERDAPVNRTFINTNGKRYGPIDDAAAISQWGGRIVPRDVDGTWIPKGPRLQSNGFSRGSDYDLAPLIHQFSIAGLSTVRPVLRVVVDLIGLTFELCQYITVTWSRGSIGGPYVGTVFRVQGISLQPDSHLVELTLLWCDDLRGADSRPYILDDENLNLLSSGSGGRTCTLTNGSTTVSFSSGDVNADGVAQGDILLVKDATESATAFKRNRTLIVTNILSATQIEVDQSDFGTGGPFVLSTWEFHSGADNYPRGIYYGKTSTLLGQFLGGGNANRILEG